MARKRTLLTLTAVFGLSVLLASGVVEIVRLVLEHGYKDSLATEARRRALEVTAQTLNGNVMGSMSVLGLIHLRVKKVASGEIPADEPSINEALRAVGQSYQATGVFVVDHMGIVQTSWDVTGKTSTGIDVNFRPYFKIAMQGTQNIYAAVTLATGERALYFAAPIYQGSTAASPVIGAMVARLGLERVDSVLQAWSGPALLLSPQMVTFASNHENWVAQMAGERTPQQIAEIRALKQFGPVFNDGTPRTLPFDVFGDVVRVDGTRYALARAPVHWNDPNGEWTVLLLGDLETAMPMSWRLTIGLASGVLLLGVSGAVIIWRRRLQEAQLRRRQAEMELRSYTRRLESDSQAQSFLAEMAAELHQAQSQSEFAERLLSRLASRLSVHYGAVYLFDGDSEKLCPVGGFGLAGEGLASLVLGQGLVGQCAKTRKVIAINDPQGTGIRIVWGEGQSDPKAVYFLPILNAERCLGVVVLASLESFEADGLAQLDSLMPMVAMNLEILERNIGMGRQAESLRQQQVQLRETEAWYRSIIDSSPDGLLIADGSGTILLANQRLEAMFGYPAGTLIGEKIERLVPAALGEHHVGLREAYMREGKAREMGDQVKMLQGVRQDGSLFNLAIGLAQLAAIGGHGPCVCASVRSL